MFKEQFREVIFVRTALDVQWRERKNTLENDPDCFTIDTKIFLDDNLLIFGFTFIFIQCCIHVRASK